jgi:hypothetical protein
MTRLNGERWTGFCAKRWLSAIIDRAADASKNYL